MNTADVLRLCYEHALKSPDPSTQNAAVLCVELDGELIPIRNTLTVNEFPRGVAYSDDRWERPLKYSVIEHAERNCIYAAAQQGVFIQQLAMVCPWAACADCARAIIQTGVRKLITHKQAHERSPQHWRDSIAIAFEMMCEAGVEVVFIDAPDLGCEPLLHSGQTWTP